MSRRTIRAGLAGGLAAALTVLGAAAHADPNPNPDVGTPIAGKAPLDLYAGVDINRQLEIWVPFAVLFPILFFHHSRSLWLVVEHLLNPAQSLYPIPPKSR